MLNRASRYLLAAIQAIIGWEWLMSGGNKLLSGAFPQGLADALNDGIKNNPNGWYVTFVQNMILPNSITWGYFIEWTEIAIGLILVGGALMLLGQPRTQGDPQYKVGIIYSIAVITAAAFGAFQNINFHFWMGGWVFPKFNPAAPFNEGIDIDGLLPPFFLLIIIANLAMIKELRGGYLFSRQQVPVVEEGQEEATQEQAQTSLLSNHGTLVGAMPF